jgi:UDP-glucose 4-epimerase
MCTSKRVLITGASGFIGATLTKLLYISGFDIRLLSRSMNIYSDHKIIICDLQSDTIPDDALDDVDTVFHLAGFSHDLRNARKISDLYYKVNVGATVQLANLAANSGVKKFVFVSSVKAGGSPPFETCANEEDQINTEDIYGKTKREAELKLLEIGKKSGMHVSIVRPSLVYGPKSKGNLKIMLTGIEKGWFPPLPEIGNRRSMIHVDDLARTILLVGVDDRANGEIFIATDGVPHSSRKIYNAMCGVVGKPIPKWSVPKSLFNIASLASPHIKYKINKLLGDECYSSAKLEALGFKAKKSLKDMNETDF